MLRPVRLMCESAIRLDHSIDSARRAMADSFAAVRMVLSAARAARPSAIATRAQITNCVARDLEVSIITQDILRKYCVKDAVPSVGRVGLCRSASGRFC